MPPKQKLYCYVDETGQETRGAFFLVSVVITGSERDALIDELERIERATNKGITKWHKAPFSQRLEYSKRTLAQPSLRGTIFFSHQATSLFVEMTIATTATAIQARAVSDYHVTVIVDGLHKAETLRFTKGLRHLGFQVRKIRGALDESNALIRLADALAGFLRDALEGQAYAPDLYEKALREGMITQV